MVGFLTKRRYQDRYHMTGFISSGTYGMVYKAIGVNGVVGDFAIKKFKPDKEGEAMYTGISQSATREIALCAELRHTNIIRHIETILQEKSIYMVFQYCEHDLLQIIHHHNQALHKPIPASTVKSIMYQVLKGCQYMHSSWVMHRDLKPANIMVTSEGQVMIGDLGLARIFRNPNCPLYNGDKVVVTIWYRAPELLLGARHYTPAIDLWAVGCIFAELLSLKPIFKGEEVKMDNKKTVPFQKNQMQKIVDICGLPTPAAWPAVVQYPEYHQLTALHPPGGKAHRPLGLETWFRQTLRAAGYPRDPLLEGQGFELLKGLLEFDPEKRLTAVQALEHPYFADGVSGNCFEGSSVEYPKRKISHEDNAASLPGTKRSGLPDDSLAGRPTKRMREA